YRIIRNDIFKADVTCLRNDSLSVKIEDLDEIMLRDEFDDTKSTIFKKNSYDYKILQNIVLKNGEVIYNKRPISERRDYYLKNLASLNETQRRLINPHFYKVDISDDLYDLKNNLINSLVKEIKEQENE
ncbi:MAG: hypothetical protein Q8R90_01745, partial [Bacteroidales bacterium]|nr:hypothetical protein [Bacteroidales bacterium]